jgi:hypothetical protein
LLWLLAGLAAAVTLFGLAVPPVKGIEGIPSQRRVGLLQRIEQLVFLYRAQDWAGVYANLTEQPPIQETVDQFRERLVGAYPRNTGRSLVGFTPESVVEQPGNQWAVWGCATLQGRGKRRTQERWMLIASWERGSWFFSEGDALAGRNLLGAACLSCQDRGALLMMLYRGGSKRETQHSQLLYTFDCDEKSDG